MGKELIKDTKMKVYSIISIWLVILALIMLHYAPITGNYEISIFSAYSIYMWIFLFSAFAMGIIIILNSSKTIWKIFGVLITVYIDVLFLLLPFLRNYYLYGRSDVITHMAYIQEIVSTASINLVNYYPISHLIVVNLHLFTGLSVNTLINIIPAFFFILYVVGLYLFAKEITSKIAETLLVVIFGTVLIFSYYQTMFLPTQLSFDMVPLILFLLIHAKNNTKNRTSYSILFTIFLLMMPFLHPLTSVNLILLIIVIIVSSIIFSFGKNDRLSFNYKDLINPLILLLVSFIAWISSKTIFDNNIKMVYNWLVNEVGTPTIDNYQDSLMSSNLGLIDVIQKIFLSFAHEFMYVGITVVALGFFVREAFKKKKLEYRMVFLTLSVITFTVLSGIFFLGSFGISNPLREIVYVLFFCTIINGIFFFKLTHESSKRIRKYSKCFLVLLIVSSSVIGLYSSYASVSTGETNSQVTYAEFVGMNWFSDYKDPFSRTYDVDKTTRRFSDIYNGINYTKQKQWMFKTAPDHFNFTNEQGYLILNEYVIERYSIYWPDNPYYSKDDLNNLRNNQLLDKVYDSPDTQIWEINGI